LILGKIRKLFLHLNKSIFIKIITADTNKLANLIISEV